eukprot:2998671-Pyramimonas_sp.AAC.1
MFDMRRSAPSMLRKFIYLRLEDQELTDWATQRGMSFRKPFLEPCRAAVRTKKKKGPEAVGHAS